MNPENILDVRPIPPAMKHPKILELFAKLASKESFILVNDHDPKPLYYYFAAELTGQFTWNYVEQGPAVWRVQIGKV